MYYLGIDVGGTTIKAGLVDELGQVSQTRKIPTIAEDLNAFMSTLSQLIAVFQESTPIAAIGLGIPGLVSLKTGAVLTSPNIPCLRNISLGRELADLVHLPINIENDANAGAYAEAVCGAARDLQHVTYITLGTGLGCGLVFSGK